MLRFCYWCKGCCIQFYSYSSLGVASAVAFFCYCPCVQLLSYLPRCASSVRIEINHRCLCCYHCCCTAPAALQLLSCSWVYYALGLLYSCFCCVSIHCCTLAAFCCCLMLMPIYCIVLLSLCPLLYNCCILLLHCGSYCY